MNYPLEKKFLMLYICAIKLVNLITKFVVINREEVK